MKLADAIRWSGSIALVKCTYPTCDRVLAASIDNHICGQLRRNTFISAMAADGWLLFHDQPICPGCLQGLFDELATIPNLQAVERLRVLTAANAEMQSMWMVVRVALRTDDLRT